MKKKIISTTLSILCIIFIGVFAPCSVFAFDEIDAIATFDEMPNQTSQIIDALKEIYTDDTYVMPKHKYISGSRVFEWTNNGVTRQCLFRMSVYYIDNNSILTGLKMKDSNGLDLYPNKPQFTYVDDYGTIRHYRINPNSITFDIDYGGTSCTINYSGGVLELIDGGGGFTPVAEIQGAKGITILFTPTSSQNTYVKNINTAWGSDCDVSVAYKIDDKNLDVNYPVSVDDFTRIVYGTVRYNVIQNNTRYGYNVGITYFNDGLFTNQKTDNDRIGNKEIFGDKYYNSYFQYNNTYNYSDSERDLNVMQYDIQQRFPQLITTTVVNSGGWDSPDFPTITGSAVLQPEIVDFTTADIPSNLMEVGTSFLSESLRIIDVIPNYMLCLGIIFMIWICYHIFGK